MCMRIRTMCKYITQHAIIFTQRVLPEEVIRRHITNKAFCGYNHFLSEVSEAAMVSFVSIIDGFRA